MVRAIVFLVLLSASSAFATEFTEKISEMIMNNQCEAAKSTVKAEYTTRSLGAKYWPTMKAVSNICVFLRTFDRMDADLASINQAHEVNDYYNREVKPAILMLTTEPLPVSKEVVESLNAKKNIAVEKINSRKKVVEAARLEEEQRRHEKERKDQEQREASVREERLRVEQQQDRLKEARNKVDTCQETKRYQLYNSQESIIDLREQLAGWQENQRQERRISQQSGVVNLSEQYNNGAWIVKTRDTIKSEFGAYKKLGGKAKTPKEVKHALGNPCADVEAELEHAQTDGRFAPK